MSHRFVVNIHRKQHYDVYVGRPSRGQTDAIWGNPFVIGADGNRAQVLEKYAQWLPLQTHLMARLPELRGKVLGCFCAPEPCHADLLAELANRGDDAGGSLSLFGEGGAL